MIVAFPGHAYFLLHDNICGNDHNDSLARFFCYNFRYVSQLPTVTNGLKSTKLNVFGAVYYQKFGKRLFDHL